MAPSTAQPGLQIRWEEPATPSAPRQPLSAQNIGPPPIQGTRKASKGPGTFYGNITLGSIQTPEKPFDYSPPKKRPRSAWSDENAVPASSISSPSPRDPLEPPAKRSKPNPPSSQAGAGSSQRKSPRTDAQKIEVILDTIKAQNLTFACFLYNIFRAKDIQGKEIHRSPTHSQTVSIFLAGRAKKTAANIISEWMAHPDGRIPRDSPNSDLMYSATAPYTDIGPVRAALTAFATQTIGKKVAVEAETAVKLSSGLHVSIGAHHHPGTELRREDFGEATISRVQSVIERDQAVTLYLCENIAMRKSRTRAGVVLERKSRPADIVITHAIASLNFCRTDQANLLPLMRGILYFGSSAPVELMNYNSRIGTMPAPTTIRRALIGLSEAEARTTAAHGSDPATAGFLLVDNCQKYHKVRDLRIGREAAMNVGMSGLYMEAPEIDVNVFNLAEKRKLIAQNRRKDITVEDLLGFLDQEDADLIGTLSILEVLVRRIPSLKPLRKEWEGNNTTELKDGMLDFLQQIGQTPESYLKRKLPVGGDVTDLPPIHDDAFKSLEIPEPQPQTHWGRTVGKNTNPASLGFSAAKIGRAAPSNMKVEFYPGSQLMYLVLDAKLLDIWRLTFKADDIFEHFEALERTGNLPDMEALLPMARKLYRAYGTARGRDHAIYDTGTTSDWAQTVPIGSPWVPQEIEDSSLEKKKRKTKKLKKPKEIPQPKKCAGDFVFAQNYMLFTFGGSTHSNYLNYVLETIMNLELECSPGLKIALLRGLIWNLSGLPGHCEEGDFIVEFFNRLLEDVVEHKSAQFDDIFIRNIISRNLRHIAELKVAWRAGVGMDKKAQKHAEPHTMPEMRTLLKVYRDRELHSRRLTRQIDDRDTDDFARGVTKLREGALQTSVTKTAHSRQVLRIDTPISPVGSGKPSDQQDSDSDDSGSEAESSESDSSESESSSEDDSDTEGERFYATRGSAYLIDGELVFDERDMMVGPEDEEEDWNMDDSEVAENN
ncbi:hypothetical protein B0H14DRAFT_2623860 [Mycena olivaceomarginata]|nr:hypothetical protein B0H14DRAFT_2623860 [Mycena olivaceomarginata]